MSNMTRFIGGSAVFGQRVSNVETAVDALIGIPMPWAGATPPTNHLLLNGAAFNKTTYPKLAAVYPSGVLPDLRGEFIRGWDNGRGVDASRALQSSQAHLYGAHSHHISANSPGTNDDNWLIGVIRKLDYTMGKGVADSLGASNVLIPSPTAHTAGAIGITGGVETRPRNVAFNYIVRAA